MGRPTQLRMQAICAAVGPYAWRTLTAEMFARRLLGAVDRLLVLDVIRGAQGGGAPDLAAIEPVDRDDDRVEPLTQLMLGFRWRDMTLDRVVQLLLGALDQWWLGRVAFDRELARLLDEQH